MTDQGTYLWQKQPELGIKPRRTRRARSWGYKILRCAQGVNIKNTFWQDDSPAICSPIGESSAGAAFSIFIATPSPISSMFNGVRKSGKRAKGNFL
jgi:hypothetical protein